MKIQSCFIVEMSFEETELLERIFKALDDRYLLRSLDIAKHKAGLKHMPGIHSSWFFGSHAMVSRLAQALQNPMGFNDQMQKWMFEQLSSISKA